MSKENEIKRLKNRLNKMRTNGRNVESKGVIRKTMRKLRNLGGI